MSIRLKQILIILLCVVALGSFFLPIVRFDIFFDFDPQTNSFSYSGPACIEKSFPCLFHMIVPLFLAVLACIRPGKHHKLQIYVTAATGIVLHIISYFIYAEIFSDILYREYATRSYVLVPSIGIGSILSMVSYVACIIIALLPERAIKRKAKAPSVKKRICLTCGTELWSDGRCPDCYDRMVLLNWLQETGQLPAKTKRPRQNSLDPDLK